MFVLDGHCLVGLQPLTQTLSLPHFVSSPECYSAPARFSCLCISCICSFFTTTPKALIQDGLYNQLALPLFPGEQDRKGSLAMTAKVGLGFKDARQHSLRGEWLCATPDSCAPGSGVQMSFYFDLAYVRTGLRHMSTGLSDSLRTPMQTHLRFGRVRKVQVVTATHQTNV